MTSAAALCAALTLLLLMVDLLHETEAPTPPRFDGAPLDADRIRPLIIERESVTV